MFQVNLKTLSCIPALCAVCLSSAYAQSYPPRTATDCAAEADYYSRSSGSTMGGAVRGAGAGLLFGAIVGDSSEAAGRGALLGGIVGGARKARQQEEDYQRAYRRCMDGLERMR